MCCMIEHQGGGSHIFRHTEMINQNWFLEIPTNKITFFIKKSIANWCAFQSFAGFAMQTFKNFEIVCLCGKNHTKCKYIYFWKNP